MDISITDAGTTGIVTEQNGVVSETLSSLPPPTLPSPQPPPPILADDRIPVSGLLFCFN